MPTLDAIFIAYGRTKTVLVLQITASLLNFILNPICIYTLDFGIGGSAMATGLSEGIAVILGLILLSKTKGFDSKSFRLNSHALRIIKVGLPMCWGTLVFAGVYWALLRWVISPLGPSVNAALGIGFSVLEGFTWPVFWGFSMGIASIVGRCLGAGELVKAKQAIQLAFRLVTLFGLLASAVFWWGGEVLAGMVHQRHKCLAASGVVRANFGVFTIICRLRSLGRRHLKRLWQTKAIFYWSAPLNLLRIPCCWLFAIHLRLRRGGGMVGDYLLDNTEIIGKWATVLSGRWQD